MKSALFISTAVVGLFILTTLFTWPISSYFIHYCWWRTFSGIQRQSGSVLSHQNTIHYTVYGSGKPVILLHGGLSNKLCWFSQLPLLTDIGYQPILVDSRGHGGSDLGNIELSYTLFAEDTLAVLDDLELDRADIIGWSDGANTALLLAKSWPERVGKIIAISGNFTPQGLTDKAKDENLKQSSGLQYLFSRWLTGAGSKFHLLEQRIKKLWQHGPNLHEKELRSITAPTLLIVGEYDSITIEHAQLMGKLIETSSLLIIQNGGHTTLITNAEELNKAIRVFLLQPKR